MKDDCDIKLRNSGWDTIYDPSLFRKWAKFFLLELLHDSNAKSKIIII